MSYPKHGANPDNMYKNYNVQMPQNIIDFSVNVNPFDAPYSISSYHDMLEAWISEYPDSNLLALKKVICSANNFLDEQLFIGNGAAQCIFLLAQYFQGKTVGIIQPTFVEYKEASQIFGCKIKELTLTKDEEWIVQAERIQPFLKEIDVLFLCNPNNPTGTVIDQSTVVEIIQWAKEAQTYLIVDEAFYDFSSIPCSVVQFVESNPHLIILRSLTKMYKLAGVRLGYVVASHPIIRAISAFSPPWSVNRFASELAIDVLSNPEYAITSKDTIQKERNRVCHILQSQGYYISNSHVNFYLLSDSFDIEKMDQLILFLLSKGVVPRHTKNFYGLDGKYIRLAVKDFDANNVLLKHLKEWKDLC